MTKSTITREQAQKIIVAADEVITALAGTNEDVHPDDSKKMCELWDDLNDRHAPPVVVRELARMALAAMDSEPVAWRRFQETPNDGGYWILYDYRPNCSGVEPLYRHAQPAVVSEKIIDNFEEEFRRAFEVSAAVEQLIEIGYQGDKFSLSIRDAATLWKLGRAAMLAAAPQSPGSEPATVPGKWIPVSERMPEVGDIVLTAMGGVVNVGETECSAANCRFFTSVISGRELPATHWMQLPAAPQEVGDA